MDTKDERTIVRNDEKSINCSAANELFHQMPQEAQKAILDFVKSLLSER